MVLTVLDELLVFWKASFVFITQFCELSTLDILEDSLIALREDDYTRTKCNRPIQQSRRWKSACQKHPILPLGRQ